MSQSYIGPAKKFYSRAVRYEGPSWTKICEDVRNNIIGQICDKVTYWRGSTYTLSGEMSEIVEDLHEAMLSWGRNHTRQGGVGPIVCAPRETCLNIEIPLSEEELLFRAWYLERTERLLRGQEVEPLTPLLQKSLAGCDVHEDEELFCWRGSAGYSLAGEGLSAMPNSALTRGREAMEEEKIYDIAASVSTGPVEMETEYEGSVSDWLEDAGWLAATVEGFVTQ
jgi:hypothetical protein